MGIGEQVGAARKAKGWSQEALADKVGISRPYVSRIESGERDVSTDVLRRLAVVLGLDPAVLLGVETTSAPAEAMGLDSIDTAHTG